jgi:hypothetical protein
MSSGRVVSLVSWVVAAVVSILSSAASAEDRYQLFFQNAYRACSDQFPPDTVSATKDFAAAREDCYAAQVSRALASLPPQSPQLLLGALQAVPDYAHLTFESALNAGIDPYYAVTAATRVVPEYSQTFASRAIGYGADPSKVTEATAAGFRREKP